INRAKAHGAGFARRVQFAVFQLERAEFRASHADGKHFRMRGGVLRRRDLIHSFAQNLSIFNDYGAKGTAAPRLHAFHPQLDRPCHETVLHRFSLSFARPRTGRPSFALVLSRASSQSEEYMPSYAPPARCSSRIMNPCKLKNERAKATLLHHSCKILKY